MFITYALCGHWVFVLVLMSVFCNGSASEFLESLTALQNILEISDLEIDIPMKSGTINAVRGVSFAIEKGKTLCLVGESGSGKSLTAMSILGLLPARGIRRLSRSRFDGRDIAHFSEREMQDLRGKMIGVIFQDPMMAFNPTMTIGRQLEEVYLRHISNDRAKARAKSLHLFRKVGMTDPEARLSQYPHELSGGLRQRAMIAMALMCEPSLLIADEPTTALDVTMQVQVLALLRQIQDDLGISILFITHDLGVVAAIADHVAVMQSGRIVEFGDVRQVLKAPREDYTRALIAAVPKTRRLDAGPTATPDVAHG
ncbi:ABC transporter ATP-binding protein [Rhizobium sp. CC-YZS058]|uniref:ABC transporter ATP-binding protein n=1 Tax=Rhizobium sp. CC-YZS058 TaxID=3042153 RepID=UPI002B053153|nr:ABC transporter ATP-binding protein [Rhizobium sp. CC-YZS058]MEA3535877.1 ABC transporter ATP-binding protein [Rhizobium sp. CC-YZS058]